MWYLSVPVATKDNEERRIEVLGKHIVVINSRVCNKQFHIVATHIFHFFELLLASFSDTLRKLRNNLEIKTFWMLLNVHLYKRLANNFVQILWCVNEVAGVVQFHLICGD